LAEFGQDMAMKDCPNPRVIEAERMAGGIFMTFDDGKSAVFPASLLREILSQAKEIVDEETET
jgi:hypothetical protein